MIRIGDFVLVYKCLCVRISRGITLIERLRVERARDLRMSEKFTNGSFRGEGGFRKTLSLTLVLLGL